MSSSRVTIDISWNALLKVVVLAAGLYVLVILRDVFIMLFTVFIFVAAVNPTIVSLQRRMNRTWAVTFFYIVLTAVLLLLVYLVVPTLVIQINALVHAVPALAVKLAALFRDHTYPVWVGRSLQSLEQTLTGFSTGLVQGAYGFFGSLATLATGFVISIYLLLEERNAKEFFHQILPASRYQAVYLTVSKISARLGAWVRGELLLMLIIGLSSLLVYVVLRVPAPLPLAVWSGLCEAVPIVGPLLGIVPALLVLLTTAGLVKALLLFVIYFVGIQQLESHVILPRVMAKALGLSPVLVIVALLVGVKLFGFVGALVAVPTAAAVSVVIGEWSSLRLIWEEEPV
jgi:predicted PurR-regulated permease PerM